VKSGHRWEKTNDADNHYLNRSRARYPTATDAHESHCVPDYPADDLSGTGAKATGGRWDIALASMHHGEQAAALALRRADEIKTPEERILRAFLFDSCPAGR